MIRFSPSAWEQIRSLSEAAYPFEGCGLMLGPYAAEKEATEIIPLKNTLRDEGRGRFDFQLSPAEFAAAQLSADQRDLDVIGIFHTHPDHPPVPSPTDTRQPMLSGWINVIASVHGGKFKEAKAWWREADDQPFGEVPLQLYNR